MEDILQRTGQGQSLRTDPRTLRSFDRDLAFYLQSGQSSEPATAQSAAGSTGVGGTLPVVSVPAGPVGARIATVASQLVGSDNSLYYSDASLPCASFVSTVLQKAGPFSDGTLRSVADQIPAAVLSHGARLVIPPGTRVNDVAALEQLAPGDIIVFQHPGRPHGHTTIYVGQGKMVGTSSSKYKVLTYTLAQWRAQPSYAAYRFP